MDASTGAGELSEDPADERLVSRTCAWCGDLIVYSGRGRRRTYCSKAHRNRAWEVRTAEKRLGRDLAAGTASAAPVREVVSRPPVAAKTAPPAPAAAAVPTRVADWVKLLGVLEEQIHGDLGRKYWDHGKLNTALIGAMRALDEATPGGLEALANRRR